MNTLSSVLFNIAPKRQQLICETVNCSRQTGRWINNAHTHPQPNTTLSPVSDVQHFVRVSTRTILLRKSGQRNSFTVASIAVCSMTSRKANAKPQTTRKRKRNNLIMYFVDDSFSLRRFDVFFIFIFHFVAGCGIWFGCFYQIRFDWILLRFFSSTHCRRLSTVGSFVLLLLGALGSALRTPP